MLGGEQRAYWKKGVLGALTADTTFNQIASYLTGFA